eukprot:tig00000241_g21030.t1
MIRFAATRAAASASARPSAASDEERETLEAQESRIRNTYEQALGLQTNGDLDGAQQKYESVLAEPLIQACERGSGQTSMRARPLAQQVKYLTLKNLAAVHEARSRPDDALRCFVRATELESSDVLLWCRLAEAARRSGLLNVARHALEVAVARNGQHPLALPTLAEVLFALGDDEAARRAALKVPEAHPARPAADAVLLALRSHAAAGPAPAAAPEPRRAAASGWYGLGAEQEEAEQAPDPQAAQVARLAERLAAERGGYRPGPACEPALETTAAVKLRAPTWEALLSALVATAAALAARAEEGRALLNAAITVEVAEPAPAPEARDVPMDEAAPPPAPPPPPPLPEAAKPAEAAAPEEAAAPMQTDGAKEEAEEAADAEAKKGEAGGEAGAGEEEEGAARPAPMEVDGSEDTAGAATQAVSAPPAASQEAAPAAAQDAAPAGALETPSAATQEAAPGGTEEAASGATEEPAPAATQEAAAGGTQDAAPAASQAGGTAGAQEAGAGAGEKAGGAGTRQSQRKAEEKQRAAVAGAAAGKAGAAPLPLDTLLAPFIPASVPAKAEAAEAGAGEAPAAGAEGAGPSGCTARPRARRGRPGRMRRRRGGALLAAERALEGLLCDPLPAAVAVLLAELHADAAADGPRGAPAASPAGAADARRDEHLAHAARLTRGALAAALGALGRRRRCSGRAARRPASPRSPPAAAAVPGAAAELTPGAVRGAAERLRHLSAGSHAEAAFAAGAHGEAAALLAPLLLGVDLEGRPAPRERAEAGRGLAPEQRERLSDLLLESCMRMGRAGRPCALQCAVALLRRALGSPEGPKPGLPAAAAARAEGLLERLLALLHEDGAASPSAWRPDPAEAAARAARAARGEEPSLAPAALAEAAAAVAALLVALQQTPKPAAEHKAALVQAWLAFYHLWYACGQGAQGGAPPALARLHLLCLAHKSAAALHACCAKQGVLLKMVMVALLEDRAPEGPADSGSDEEGPAGPEAPEEAPERSPKRPRGRPPRRPAGGEEEGGEEAPEPPPGRPARRSSSARPRRAPAPRSRLPPAPR